MTSLSSLAVGQEAKIIHFEVNKKSLLRFMEMGLSPHKKVQMLGTLPLGGNLVILSEHGKYILRKQTAKLIKIIKT